MNLLLTQLLLWLPRKRKDYKTKAAHKRQVGKESIFRVGEARLSWPAEVMAIETLFERLTGTWYHCKGAESICLFAYGMLVNSSHSHGHTVQPRDE